MEANAFSLAVILALGAAHGVNPAMGWLFAVSLGLQEQRLAAVWRSLGPLALGHALAIAAAVSVAAALGMIVPLGVIKLLAAGALLAFGVYHLTRHLHPRLAGMRVGAKDLTVWSFLMASAHGAGLMVVPFVLGASETGTPGSHAPLGAGHTGHVLSAGLANGPSVAVLATVVHTAGYLLVSGLIGWLIYEKLGVRLLRTAWINLDLIWGGALVLTAALTLAWPT